MPTPMPTWMVVALIVAGVVAWVMFFVAILRAAARKGGWAELAEKYAFDSQVDSEVETDQVDERFRYRSIRMKCMVNYGGIVELRVTDAGLRLRLVKWLGFGHRPLLLPWGEMRIETGRWLLVNTMVIRMAAVPDAPIRIRHRLGVILKEAAEDRWPGA